MHLLSLLFLTEGMLKVPPKLLVEITKYARQILARKYLETFQDSIYETNKIVDRSKNALNNVTKVIEGLDFQYLKSRKQTFLWRGVAYSEKIFGSKLIFPFYEVHGATFLLKHEPNSSLWALQIANNRSVWYQSEFFSAKDKQELIKGIQKILISFYTYYYRKSKEIFDSIQKYKVFLRSQIDIPDLSYTQKIILSPEWFIGWNPGNKKLDIDKLTGNILNIHYVYNEQTLKATAGSFSTREDDEWNIYIYLPEIRPGLDKSIFENNYDFLAETINHELGHFAQEAIGVVTTGEDEETLLKSGAAYEKFGVPSRKLHYKDKQKQDLTPRLLVREKSKVPHELLDTEFYTRLGDTFGYIRSKLRQIKKMENRKLEFVNLVGQKQTETTDSWLLYLLDKDINKWRKAVSTIYAQLKSEGEL